MSSIPPLSSAARLALRSFRHDLAGRAHVLFAAVELLEDPSLKEESVSAAAGLLDSARRSWSDELRRLDVLIDGVPSPTVVDGRTLGLALQRRVPDGRWVCDPEALGRAVQCAYRSVGRCGFRRIAANIETVDDGILLRVSAGDAVEGQRVRPTDAFPGDLDVALLEAESRVAGVLVDVVHDASGFEYFFHIPAATD